MRTPGSSQSKTYYINTRGVAEDGFWNTASTLFVSATRPDNRFFAFVDWHRMSSLFLEPVSLGNYCILIAACTCACGGMLSRGKRCVSGTGDGGDAGACDGRLAAVTVLAIVALTLVVRALPRQASLLFPVLTLLRPGPSWSAWDCAQGETTFSGRVAHHTVALFGRLTMNDYMGMSDALLDTAVDSGISYLIVTQSIVVTALVWAVICTLAMRMIGTLRASKASMAVYISFALLVSFSF